MRQERCDVMFKHGYFADIDCYVDYQCEDDFTTTSLVGFGFLDEHDEECDLTHMLKLELQDFENVLHAAIDKHKDKLIEDELND